MDFIKEIFPLFGPAILSFFSIVFLILRSLSRRARRSEENDKKHDFDYLRNLAYMVKYCGLPIEVYMQELKDKSVALSTIPDDDILSQILEKQLGVR